jgi:histidinol phosphatase-like enzyme
MGRYTEYFKEIWQMQASRKVIGLTLFGVIYNNTTPFTPGNQLSIADGAIDALGILTKKGYDFLIIAGQPPNKTKNLEIIDFENILTATKELVDSVGGRIKNAYYAPSTDKTDPFVKPNPGMFERAQTENMVVWEESYYIGAELNDVKAAVKVKAKPVLIKPAGSVLKTKTFELTNNVKADEYSILLDFANSL